MYADKALLRYIATAHPDDILEPYATLMTTHGFDAVSDFVMFFHGDAVYVPSMRTILRAGVRKEIANDFITHGMSESVLATKYGYTRNAIRRMIKKLH